MKKKVNHLQPKSQHVLETKQKISAAFSKDEEKNKKQTVGLFKCKTNDCSGPTKVFSGFITF